MSGSQNLKRSRTTKAEQLATDQAKAATQAAADQLATDQAATDQAAAEEIDPAYKLCINKDITTPIALNVRTAFCKNLNDHFETSRIFIDQDPPTSANYIVSPRICAASFGEITPNLNSNCENMCMQSDASYISSMRGINDLLSKEVSAKIDCNLDKRSAGNLSIFEQLIKLINHIKTC